VAEPLTSESGLAPVEEGVRLLREAPLSTWLCYWTGALPFALAALRFGNDVTNPRFTPGACAIESLGLAVLLVWMNCWRAVFAGRLRRSLSGSQDPAWTAARVCNLAACQAFCGAARLLVNPLSGLIVFPFAWTVAFFRITAVVAGAEDITPSAAMAKARQLAAAAPRANWSVLPILAFLYLIVLLNVAIVLGVLPQLVRMLTGYESSFSRSGMYYAANPLFVLLVLFTAWMAIDPLVQAVYCVLAFRGESAKTGEDLRIGIRRVAAAALLLLLAMLRPLGAVTPAELGRAIHQAAQSSEYDWRLLPAAGARSTAPWLVRMVDRMIDGVRLWGHRIGDLLSRLFKWIFGENRAANMAAEAPSRGLHWSLYVLILAVVLFAVWMLVRRRRARRQAVRAVAEAAPIRLDAEDLSADRLPEERWNELAEQALRDGNPRLALRALYLGSLAWLGRREYLAISSGKTNREYETELRRRARSFPEARGLFTANVAAFERAWYGLHEVAAGDLGAFRERTEGMKTALAREAAA
jgi:hypothetical protein